VWLQDSEPAAVQLAVSRGAGSAAEPDQEPDLVLVATPPSAVAGQVHRANQTYLNAKISDTASTKADLLAEVESLGADMSRVVLGHPLAGSEASGARGARADLFRDRVWVLTPGAAAAPERVEAVTAFADGLGAVDVELDARGHDRAVALTSHLPQLLSSVLAGRLAAEGAADTRLSGQGLRDMTRIAASDPALWTQILCSNAASVVEALDPLVAELGRVRDALRQLAAQKSDGAAVQVVTDALEAGNAGRSRIPGKHGMAERPTDEVVVVIPDRPGQLAALFTLAGEIGVNLEDVRIDHALGRPTGLVELQVAAERAATLREALAGEGWDVISPER
jgi:prephenate dehydrogenase